MDMKKFKEQLELYFFTKKMTPFAFSKASGIGQSSLSRLLNDEVKNTLKQKTKDKLSSYFDIDFDEIDEDPSIINLGSYTPFSTMLSMTNMGSKVIPLMTYNQFIKNDKSNIQTLPVTNDISSECFALIVENSDIDYNISDGDIIIVDPDTQLTKSQYVGKNLVLNFEDRIILREALVGESGIFLRGKNIDYFDENKYNLLGWVTEIRIKNRSLI